MKNLYRLCSLFKGVRLEPVYFKVLYNKNRIFYL